MNNHNVEKLQPTGIFTNYIFKALPLAFDESMSYYECLCNLLDYLKNTVIPTINNNADAIIEIQNNVNDFEENITNSFTEFTTTINNTVEELENYMNNYFDNLDVQEEINNKMDQMVLDGTMDQLLNTNLTGSLSNLATTDKSNLVNAINEVNENNNTNTTNIGTLSNLDTIDKSNLVDAINEIDSFLTYDNNEHIVGYDTNNNSIYETTIDLGDLTDSTRYTPDGIIIETTIRSLKEVLDIKVMGSLANASVYKNITNFIYWSPSNSRYGLMEFLVNNDSPAVFICKSTQLVPSETGITSAYATIRYKKYPSVNPE